LPWRIEYCETFLDVRRAQPFSVAGIVSTSPTTILPIGYVIGRLIYLIPFLALRVFPQMFFHLIHARAMRSQKIRDTSCLKALLVLD
jgi:hypothetical protein